MPDTDNQALKRLHQLLNLSETIPARENGDNSDIGCSHHHVVSFKLFLTLSLIYQITEFRNHGVKNIRPQIKCDIPQGGL